jgi:hypothetical protein
MPNRLTSFRYSRREFPLDCLPENLPLARAPSQLNQDVRGLAGFAMVNNLRASAALVIVLSLAPVSQKPAFAADAPAAILITNGAYDSPVMTPITTAAADGDAFQKHLIAAGFDPSRINRYSNLKNDDFHNVIDTAKVTYKNVGAFVFYYSGHGILYGQQPRFIPTDFSFVKLQGQVLAGVTSQTISVGDIVQIGKDAGGPALFVFDACRDPGNGIFAKLYALEQTEATTDGRQSMMRLDAKGAFDNVSEATPGEYLGRDNTLAMLAAVKTRNGPGISYVISGDVLSVFTGSLLSNIDKNPGRGLSEIFPLVKTDVLSKTEAAHLIPPQQPYEVDIIAGNLTLSDFAHLPPSLTIAELPSSAVANYVAQIKESQAQAVVANRSFIVSAPVRLTGVSVPALIPYPKPPASAPPLRVYESPQTAPPANVTTSPSRVLNVRLTARLWDPATDEKTYGARAGNPPIRIPTPSTVSTRLSNGITEYRDRITADRGFRIVTLDASTRAIKDVATISTIQETDVDGVTAETVVWTASSGESGRPAGRYAADLHIVERRPHGTTFLPLTGTFELRQDQSVVLPLTPEKFRQLDALQLIAPDGVIVAELQTDTTKILKDLGWWLSLRNVNGGLVLQTSGTSAGQ